MEEPMDVVAERLVREALGLNSNNSSNVTITHQNETNWQRTFLLLAALAGCMFGFFGLYIANDTRNQARSDQIKSEQALTELRQDIKAIRAYINAGLVQPKGK
jgi:hypothetical protein